jgi:hypothetical protein|nr:MAG TPA: hypothetical protein [Caudoviricetes sp.]
MTQQEKINRLLDFQDCIKEELVEITPMFDGIKHNPELPLDLRVSLVYYYTKLKNIGAMLEKPGCLQRFNSINLEEEMANNYAKILHNLFERTLNDYGHAVRYERNGEFVYTYSEKNDYDPEISSLTSEVYLITYDKIDIENYTQELESLNKGLGWIFNFRRISQLKELIKEKEEDIQRETTSYEFKYAKWKRKNK